MYNNVFRLKQWRMLNRHSQQVSSRSWYTCCTCTLYIHAESFCRRPRIIAVTCSFSRRKKNSSCGVWSRKCSTCTYRWINDDCMTIIVWYHYTLAKGYSRRQPPPPKKQWCFHYMAFRQNGNACSILFNKKGKWTGAEYGDKRCEQLREL